MDSLYQDTYNCTSKVQDRSFLAPGDGCETTDQCFGNATCSSSVCHLKSGNKGDACNSNARIEEHWKDCNIGHYCKGGFCEPVVKLGMNCSLGDYCEYGSSCYSGKCTAWYTLEDSTGFQISSGDARLCKSGNIAM